jgi:ABC-type sulfate transport system permease subunit
MKDKEELEIKAAHEAIIRIAIPVTAICLSVMVLALFVMAFWDAFAHDMHLPQLDYPGALGATGLVLLVAAIPAAFYLVCVKEFE